MLPFLGPAFLGAVLSAARKKYRRKGKLYWISAVCWSTVAGAALTPLFAHAAGIPENVAQSSATFVAIMGHEALNFLYRQFGLPEDKEFRDPVPGTAPELRPATEPAPWDGTERRSANRSLSVANPETAGGAVPRESLESKSLPGIVTDAAEHPVNGGLPLQPGASGSDPL